MRNAGDLFFQMGWKDHPGQPQQQGTQQALFAQLTAHEARVVEILREGREMTLDEIEAKSGLPLPKIASIVLELEMKNVVRCLPGRLYKTV